MAPLGAGWPCAAPCSPQRAENKIVAWGFHCCSMFAAEALAGCLLLPFVVVCHSVLVEIRESDGCYCPEVTCRRNGIKKRRTSDSSRILESHRLMSCQNVTASTHTSKGKVKSCQNLTFSQALWVSSIASTNTPVGAQEECTSKTLGLVKLDWPGKFNPGQLALPCL